MISSEQLSVPAARAIAVAQRFQKFLVVGAIGLGVNQGLLFLFREAFQTPLYLASPAAIFVSMLVTFMLNEHWTWHDRGTGPIFHRILLYFPINTIGLLINFGVLYLLVHEWTMHYLIANLFGAGVAAMWNFAANHHVTWRDAT